MTMATATRPSVAVTFPDGCVLTYDHPEGDQHPRVTLSPCCSDHDHLDPEDAFIGQVVGRTFLEALARSGYEPQPTTEDAP